MLLAVQDAVLAKLAGITVPHASGTGASAVGVYDRRPTNTPMPFIGIDGHQATDHPATGVDAEVLRHVVTLAVWSDYKGQRQILEILAAMHAALHNTRLTLDVGQALSCRVSAQVSVRDPDDTHYRGTMTVDVIAAYESED